MPHYKKALGAFAAAAASFALATPAQAAIGSTPVTLAFNTYDASNDGFVGPVSASDTLRNNTYYTVTATGTWSNWNATLWDYGKVCGTPTAAPLTPSTGQVNYKAGLDPEFVYAFARGRRYDCTTLVTPKAQDKLKVSVDGTYRDYPAAGSPAAPTASHAYTYGMRSSSGNRPFNVQFEDPHSSDNYGVITYSIRTAKKTDCAAGAWSAFRDGATAAFASQAACETALPAS